MKVKAVVLGDATLVMGLTLAGMEESRIVDESTFEETLEKVLKDSKYGIVIIQEDFLRKVDWRLKKKLDSLAYPVVVPVPGVSGAGGEEGDIRNLVKRALGFDLMSQEKK